jgi:F-type H+-transporting ATPase subunit c
MDADAAKLVGAGLAALGIGLAAVGVGSLIGQFFQGAFRNPSAAAQFQGLFFVGVAFAEALGLFAFIVAVVLLFVA